MGVWVNYGVFMVCWINIFGMQVSHLGRGI